MATDKTPSASEAGNTISVGRDAIGSNLIAGNNNTASLSYLPVSLPSPDSVDIRAELAALRVALANLNAPDQRKVDNALGDADTEMEKPDPDKDEVGKAIDRALGYAKKAEGFAGIVETLLPHVTSVAAWLGSNWYQLLATVGAVI